MSFILEKAKIVFFLIIAVVLANYCSIKPHEVLA